MLIYIYKEYSANFRISMSRKECFIMIAKIISIYSSMDKKTKKLMTNGLIFCFILAVISSLLLLIYDLFYSSITLYYIGFYLFKNSILFASIFLVFALGFDRLKKELE